MTAKLTEPTNFREYRKCLAAAMSRVPSVPKYLTEIVENDANDRQAGIPATPILRKGWDEYDDCIANGDTDWEGALSQSADAVITELFRACVPVVPGDEPANHGKSEAEDVGVAILEFNRASGRR